MSKKHIGKILTSVFEGDMVICIIYKLRQAALIRQRAPGAAMIESNNYLPSG
jgi:hypothetical protein